MRLKVLFGDELEIEPHTAGEDGRGDLVRLGGRQDEDGVGGRLFERLQKRIEGAVREHMHLVHDIHFILSRNGRILHLFAKVAHLVDAVVGGGVDL